MKTAMRRRGRPRGAAGASLLETVLGMAFFAVAVLSTMSVVVQSARLDRANAERRAGARFEPLHAELDDVPAADGHGPGVAVTQETRDAALLRLLGCPVTIGPAVCGSVLPGTARPLHGTGGERGHVADE